MVRLKRGVKIKHAAFLFLSQFHYGSIKTVKIILKFSEILSSQFHYGSIKTKMGNFRMSPFFNRLNSTMVRLKQLAFFAISLNNGKVSIPLWFD